jgi:hypothetical protein
MNTTVNARGLARLGMLAMGLGVGATVASTPGIASGDSLDFQISIDGYDHLPTAGNSATATSEMGDFAIDIGYNTGPNEFALAGIGNNDFSFVDADNSSAYSGGDLLDANLPGSNDVAIVTTLATETNAAAAVSADWWADLLALF